VIVTPMTFTVSPESIVRTVPAESAKPSRYRAS